ncbi:MAG: methyl-accepting chemotaxis protein [Synergistaceae bacterium]|jgi:methyl-accepting chemotaxis protein|nr:methyl-accepting chemotaxis protein [Synergistaceae bacterium]
MWKNFKLSFKLLLGFGLLLVIFVASIVISWSNMAEVREDSDFLSTQIVPVVVMNSELEREAYELFLAVRQMQFLEDADSMTAVRAAITTTGKKLDEIGTYRSSHANLQTPAYVIDNVLPVFKDYVKDTEKNMDFITKKNEAYNEMLEGMRILSTSAQRTKDIISEVMLEEIKNGDTAGIMRRLDLMHVGEEIASISSNLWVSMMLAMDAGDVTKMRSTFDMFEPFEKNMRVLDQYTNTDEKTQLVARMRAAIRTYATNMEAYIELYKQLQDINIERLSLFNQFNTASSKATTMAQDRIRSLSRAAVASLSDAIFLMNSCTGLAMILGILIAIFISRSISKPLNTIVQLAKRVGDGDMTVEYKEFGYEGKDELGTLSLALSQMITDQEKAMQQILSVAVKLSDEAVDLSAISQETDASMMEVKSSIEQVASLSEANGAALEECNAGVEEMSAGADTVAQSSTDSAAFLSQTTGASQKAIQTVSGVISGMHNVDKNAKESENKIRQLVSSVDNVSSFVSVITGIADQTNLLALNAAIEAARAGEVGRGFAVVAEEVRKLAEESARAAQNVNGIIVELQNGAHESIKATIEAGRVLGDTLVQAEQAQGELDSALRQINKANDSIQNIAAVAEEQAASSKEVATAIDNATQSTMEVVEAISHIRHASEDTAQAAQGIAKQSESLSSYAHDLSNILSKFKLDVAAPVVKVTKSLKPQKKAILKTS